MFGILLQQLIDQFHEVVLFTACEHRFNYELQNSGRLARLPSLNIGTGYLDVAAVVGVVVLNQLRCRFFRCRNIFRLAATAGSRVAAATSVVPKATGVESSPRGMARSFGSNSYDLE